jgi:acetyl esterase/lipase
MRASPLRTARSLPFALMIAMALGSAPAKAVVLPSVPTDIPSLSAGPTATPGKYCTAEGTLVNCTRWFSAGNGTKLLVDVWRPAGATSNSDLPTVVVFHGGGYDSGWRGRSFGEGNARFLAQQGFVALTVDYRLGPCVDTSGRACLPTACRDAGLVHPCVDFTETVDEFDRELSLDDLQGDVASAVASARNHARLYGGDLQGKVGTWGTSAGAGLALWANYRGRVLHSRADVGVGYAGALVFDPVVYARYGQDLEQPRTSPGTVVQMLGCPRDDDRPGETYDGCDDGTPGLDELDCPPQLYPKGSPCAARYRRASVTSAIDKSDPPARVVHARNDVQSDSRNAWLFWREMHRLGLVQKTHFERWVWENNVSCVRGGTPGVGCPVGNNSLTAGQDDCGSTHTAFENCVYDDENDDGHGQPIDRGGLGGHDNITLPSAYDDKSEGLITTCFLMRYLDNARWLARADCPRT